MSNLTAYNKTQNLADYLPDYYENSRQMQAIMSAEQPTVDGLGNDINDVLSQTFIGTATWGLDTWEKIFGIPTDPTKSDDQRRSILLGQLQNSGLATIPQLQATINSFLKRTYTSVAGGQTYTITNNGSATVVDHPESYTIDCIWPLGDVWFSNMVAAINQAVPAHIQTNFIAQQTATEQIITKFRTTLNYYPICGTFICGDGTVV